jgi:hypothetical protein
MLVSNLLEFYPERNLENKVFISEVSGVGCQVSGKNRERRTKNGRRQTAFCPQSSVC